MLPTIPPFCPRVREREKGGRASQLEGVRLDNPSPTRKEEEGKKAEGGKGKKDQKSK